MKLHLPLTNNIVLTFFLIIAIFFSLWIARFSIEKNNEYQPSDSKDAFMTGVSFTSFDMQGQWESGFYSPYIEHYHTQDSALLEKPYLTARGENDLTWTITADKGTSYEGGKTIVLKENVIIERLNTKNHTKAKMETPEITLYPKKKYLSTAEPVRIEQTGSVLEAIGFTADITTGDIELSSQSKGTIAPSS